ncbi:hypothetical protein MTR_7g084990 [Medicago truncatula]|uniref:Uncharacterized protein n=1 Tax=Medicago truncatula TaxID=3880 RepID=G7KYD7_MEDTR|nr:hypothetical protein MTR_7g084990 [Medicago truncatula]
MQRLWRSRILFCDGEIQIMKVVVCCRMIICSSVTIPTVMLDGFIEIFTMSSEFSTFAVLGQIWHWVVCDDSVDPLAGPFQLKISSATCWGGQRLLNATTGKQECVQCKTTSPTLVVLFFPKKWKIKYLKTKPFELR